MRDLLSLTLDKLEARLLEFGQPRYRAKQIFTQAHAGTAPADMTNLPQSLRLWADDNLEACSIEKSQKSSDGTEKLLFKMEDGALVEAVIMRYNHGATMCLSTQVGCKMGCLFCASTLGGLSRNLYAGEMVAMFLAANRLLGGKTRNINNIVLMGSGEPFDNYDEVLLFLRQINNSEGAGVGWRHISLSTCGLIEPLKRFMKEKCPVTLCISLHAPLQDLRAALIPAARFNPLQDLLGVCREYIKVTGRRVIFEYALMDGVNDSEEMAKSLTLLVRGMQAHINVIAINPVAERAFEKPSRAKTDAFLKILTNSGVSATLRRTLGEDIDGACGQLRWRAMKNDMG